MTAAPYVGQPATIILRNDTHAAVVVKVNPKSIVVDRVETDPATRERLNDPREPYPVFAETGLTDRPLGGPVRYLRTATGYRNGSVTVTLGKSVKITDYRY